MIDTSKPVRDKSTGEEGEVVSVGAGTIAVQFVSGVRMVGVDDLENTTGQVKGTGPRLERK